jgi:predicted permease
MLTYAKSLRAALLRFANLFRNQKLDRELSEELRSHLEFHIEDNLRAGMSPSAARRNAVLKLGGFQHTTEDVRDSRSMAWLESLLRDLRFGIRQLRKRPAFVLAAILSFALGIGANATIFSIVSSFVLRPAPVGNPNSLLSLHISEGPTCCNHFSGPIFEDVRDTIQSFSDVAGYYELVPASIGGQGEPERIWGQLTSTNYFDVAQLGMSLGRGFTQDEDHQPVIVISNRIWRRRFNSAPNVIGKTLLLSGHPYTIVGVTPPAFHGLDLILDTQFWVPLGNVDQLADQIAPKASDRASREYHWLAVIARLKPGFTREQATAELNILAANSATAHPQFEKNLGFKIYTANSVPPRDRSTIVLFLTALSVVALLVLCIACANVTNLFLAHAAARQGEMAVRVSLGASKIRLLRQILTESMLLSLSGGALGVLLSLWATKGLSSFRPPVPVPLDLTVSLDWRVLVYAFALSIFAGLLFGFAPAWTASHPSVSTALKGEELFARAGRFFTLRNTLVVAQVAISIVLLCATGLFLRSLKNASTIDTGFRITGTLTMSVDPRVHGYTPERIVRFLHQLRERTAALPGATGSAYTDLTPLSMGGRSDGFSVVGRPASGSVPIVDLYMVSPGYFDLLGIPRVAGRDFSNETVASPRVAIVNERFAETLFGKDNPVGQQVNGAGVIYEIIGVVKNTKSRTVGEETRPVLFRALSQTITNDPSVMGYSILVGYAGDPSALSLLVRDQIHTLDPSLAVYNFKTMSDHLREALFLPRLAGILFGLFGFLGLFLAAIGLYSVMSYSVSRRTREIGIRLALGAPADGVRRLVVRQGMTIVAIAMFVGVPAALAAAKISTAFLYGVQPHDLPTFIAVPLFLVAVALLACYLPARRASKVDPMVALRYE